MFIDTNVLIHARIHESPDHPIARARLQQAVRDGEPLRISRQVIREYLAVLTRPQTWLVPLPREEALASAGRLLGGFQVLEDGPAVTETLLALFREVPVGGRQIHDANIVATMLAHGERRLFTFNIADFRRYTPHIQLADH